jgi:type IV pilus assembly protein PilA
MERLRTRRVMGFSLIELLVVIAIILIIMGMAIPQLTDAKMRALELGALKAISTIHTAEAQYQSQYGRYASTLAELGPPATGAPSAACAGLISGGLASGQKSGYKYSLQPTDVGYTISANPVAFNNTGKRTFYSDQSLITHQNSTAEPASAASPEVDPK